MEKVELCADSQTRELTGLHATVALFNATSLESTLLQSLTHAGGTVSCKYLKFGSKFDDDAFIANVTLFFDTEKFSAIYLTTSRGILLSVGDRGLYRREITLTQEEQLLGFYGSMSSNAIHSLGLILINTTCEPEQPEP